MLDANILACKERLYLLKQLADSKAWIDFSQGLDARFITEEVAKALNAVKKNIVHFAFDFMKNEKAIVKGLKMYSQYNKVSTSDSVYILTNFDTTIEEDLYRVKMVQEAGFIPDIRIYRKNTAPQILRDLQRWSNNRFIYRSCDFMNYVPRKDGKTIRELYFL